MTKHTFNPEQIRDIKLNMLNDAITAMASYDELAKAILPNGPEAFGECLSVLTGNQVLKLVKRVQKSITRSVYNKYAQIHRAQHEAVRGQGVNGHEVSFSEFVNDYQGNEYAAGDAPDCVLHEAAAYELYCELLQPAYLIAEKAVFGWRDDYVLQGLPFYYYESGSEGQWINVVTMEEAFTAIDREREQFKDAKRREELEAIGKLRLLKVA
jgi:hypothetical protein